MPTAGPTAGATAAPSTPLDEGAPTSTAASVSTPIANIPMTPARPTGVWFSDGSIPEKLWGDGVVQLSSGRVVVFAASAGSPQSATLDTWVYDPQTGTTSGGPAMAAAQAVPAVAALGDGSVMIAGGWTGSRPISDAEILDGATGSFIPIKSMLSPRSHATATDIGNGRVLVAGGWSSYNSRSKVFTATASAEIFDRNSGDWSWAAPMSTPRALASATRLPDGRVLVAGGDESWLGADSTGASQTVLSSAEIYDPSTNTWQSAGAMSVPRATHSAALLPDGHVLVTGGWSDGHEYGLSSTEEYIPGAGWQRASDMPDAHAQARLVTLQDGRLLEVGGVDGSNDTTGAVDLFDPSSGAWQRTGSLQQPLYWPAVTVLADGRVLLVGGATESGTLSNQLETYGAPSR